MSAASAQTAAAGEHRRVEQGHEHVAEGDAGATRPSPAGRPTRRAEQQGPCPEAISAGRQPEVAASPRAGRGRPRRWSGPRAPGRRPRGRRRPAGAPAPGSGDGRPVADREQQQRSGEQPRPAAPRRADRRRAPARRRSPRRRRRGRPRAAEGEHPASGAASSSTGPGRRRRRSAAASASAATASAGARRGQAGGQAPARVAPPARRVERPPAAGRRRARGAWAARTASSSEASGRTSGSGSRPASIVSVSCVGQVGADVGERGDRLADRARGGGGPVAEQRVLAAEALVQGQRQGVDVGGGPGPQPVGLLGRHVGERPEHVAGAGQGPLAGDPGDAEVDELRLAARGDQDVLGLDVAVDDAVAVGVRERGGGSRRRPRPPAGR